MGSGKCLDANPDGYLSLMRAGVSLDISPLTLPTETYSWTCVRLVPLLDSGFIFLLPIVRLILVPVQR